MRPLTEGLGFVAGSHCPHFDHDGRRGAYTDMVGDGRLPGGLAVDDLAVAHLVDGTVQQVFAATLTATAYRVDPSPDGLPTVTPLPTTPLDP